MEFDIGNTRFKIVSMLEDIGIEITGEIRKVIREDRHAIIHKGSIGSGKTYDVLDKLSRQVVVKPMNYTQPTAHTVLQSKQIAIMRTVF